AVVADSAEEATPFESSPGRFLPSPPSALDALAADFEVNHEPFRYLKGRTELVDSLIRSTASQVFDAGQMRGLVIAAVGGYGRSELFPFSDVDLLVLIPSES